MSASPPRSHVHIERDAAVWVARFENGGLTNDQRSEFDSWLRADPEHARVLARYRDLHASLAAQIPLLMDAAEVNAIVARAGRLNRIRRAAAPALAAAAALVVATVAWWSMPEHIETASRERRAVALDDGSRIELNARTHLEVSLGRSERRVKLSRGEVMFQVMRDPARPFIVETPQGTVRVTGTVFNVRETQGNAVEVTLLEGSVQLTPQHHAERPAVLAVNEQGVMQADGVDRRALTADDAQNVTAWRTGQAAFTALPLGEALARFMPYHSGTITIDDSARSLRVGGRYSLDDLDGFLAALEQALPVSVLRGDAGRIRIVGREASGK